MKTLRQQRKNTSYLDGQLLLAMPTMADKRFQRSVIYLCTHSADGAMGLIVNQRANHISFTGLLKQLGIVGDDADETVPPELLGMSVHVGGPVSSERGFVLHSADYFAQDSTLEIDGGVCLTATIDILKAMAGGKGPEQAILALGYAGWAPGQLESEIQANGWLHCPADRDLLFSPDLELKYDRALSKIGIDPSHLVSDAGHA
ncbi:MAG TPA: YqgE/AlgH family protein [Hyphomicrobiaceae bacterium]|jgi:putative transcriptional regulator|nr:YqgE/AlgH family protein [Hyphomicrobiaceae bacterium]